MRKLIVSLILVCLLVPAVWAQTTFTSATYGRYVAWVDGSQQEAEELAMRMALLFDMYNDYFRFDENEISVPLAVRKFKDKTAFNAYLQKVIGTTKDDFVYLHYPTAERSELVIFDKTDAVEFSASLAHQGFVQFLKAFVPNPPLWMREGFAVYFEQAQWDPVLKNVSLKENLAWLETVKLLAAEDKLFMVNDLMGLSDADARASLDVFYPQSWALVSFFLNTTTKYNRFIWDAIALLRSEVGKVDAQLAVDEFFERWYGYGVVDSEFLAYIDSQMTFAEYVTTGVDAYGAKDFETARSMFYTALVKNDNNYIPYYYIGLIAYADNDYRTADLYYKTALKLGSDQAITNYAMGINSFAARNYDEARGYLVEASRLDPARYQAKVAELLDRLADETETAPASETGMTTETTTTTTTTEATEASETTSEEGGL